MDHADTATGAWSLAGGCRAVRNVSKTYRTSAPTARTKDTVLTVEVTDDRAFLSLPE